MRNLSETILALLTPGFELDPNEEYETRLLARLLEEKDLSCIQEVNKALNNPFR